MYADAFLVVGTENILHFLFCKHRQNIWNRSKHLIQFQLMSLIKWVLINAFRKYLCSADIFLIFAI